LIKLKLLQSFTDIFAIKTGAIRKVDKKCYKVKRWFEILFKVYYHSSVVYFIVLFMFLLQPHFFNNLLLNIFETIIMYIILEFLIIFILPIEKVPCWRMQEK